MQGFLLELGLYRRAKRAFWLACLAAGLDAFALASSIESMQESGPRLMAAGGPAAAFALALLAPRRMFAKPWGAAAAGQCWGAASWIALSWLVQGQAPRGADPMSLLAASAGLGLAWGLLCHGFDRDEGARAGQGSTRPPALAAARAPAEAFGREALAAAWACWPQWAAKAEDGEGPWATTIDFAAAGTGFRIAIERVEPEPGEPDFAADSADFIACFEADPAVAASASLEELRDRWVAKLREMGVEASALG